MSEAIAALLRPGMRVFIHAGMAEPHVLRESLAAQPEACAGVEFVGVFLPGMNGFDYAALHPTASARLAFIPPGWRVSFADGRTSLVPLHYSAIDDFLRARPLDLAILHVAPPDADGRCALGLNADFAGAAAAHARSIAAIVNPAMPRTRGETVAWSRITHVVEHAAALPTLAPSRCDAAQLAAGRHAAGLIRDGDTIQIGLGAISAAVLRALDGHKSLGVHTGLLIDEFVDLAEKGVITGAAKTLDAGLIVTGQAAGSQRLYDFCAEASVVFQPTSYTHAPGVLAQIDNFVAINSAAEVDLFGQAQGETIGGRQISGIGGFADFTRAARIGRGGRSLVVLPAASRTGSRTGSRIVARLAPPGVVGGGRADADFVVTEHGVAALRHASIDERAARLIAIADPAYRDDLARDWRAIRSAL